MKITYYGYFGRTQNVRPVAGGAPSADAVAKLIEALPRRRTAEIVDLEARRRG